MASLQTRSHGPQMTMLMLLFIISLLLHFSFGFETSNVSCAGTLICPQGLCCNNDFYCGVTSGFCGQSNCSKQCPAQWAQCGQQFGNVGCPDGSCCSEYGWCGIGDAWCIGANCTYQCISYQCVGVACPDGYCCNNYGYCGITPAFCGQGNCKSQCPPSPAPVPAPVGVPVPSPAPVPAPVGVSVPSPGAPVATRGSLQKPGGSKVGTTVGISVGVVAFLIACSVVALFVWKRYRATRRLDSTADEGEDGPIMVEGMPERLSYRHLTIATKDFSEESKLGQGGFGSVYHGVLPSSGMPVAIKKISGDSNQGEKEFMAEVSIISRLRHRNLIQLQGWCKCKDGTRDQYLLVYELMPNGSLDKVLFGPNESQMACLSWSQRFDIVTGTAAAVDYLHKGWNQQVIHRDIKSSNIMLDEDWNPKLGDFGLARLVDHKRTAASTIVAGTYGYIAPEVVFYGRYTDKTDVYAFGAVALEIACGRKAFSSELPPEEIYLVDWVWERLSEGALLSTVDKRLQGYEKYWIEVVLIVGLWCSHPDPTARPSMRHVVQVLAGDVKVPSIPASKPAASYSYDSQKVFIHSTKPENRSKSLARSITLVATSISDDSTLGSSRKSGGTSSISSAFSRSGDSYDNLLTAQDILSTSKTM